MPQQRLEAFEALQRECFVTGGTRAGLRHVPDRQAYPIRLQRRCNRLGLGTAPVRVDLARFVFHRTDKRVGGVDRFGVPAVEQGVPVRLDAVARGRGQGHGGRHASHERAPQARKTVNRFHASSPSCCR